MRILFALIVFIPITVFSQPKKLDSLLNVWKDSTQYDLEKRIEAIDFVAWNGYIGYKNDSAIFYGKWISDHAKKISNSKFIASGLNTQAEGHLNLGHYDEAIQLFNECANLRLKDGDSLGYTNANFNIGNAYKKSGNREKAITQYENCFEYYKKIKKKSGMAMSINGLGLINFELNNNETAINQYNIAVNLYEELNDKNKLANTYTNISLSYIKMNDYSNGFTYMNKSLAIREELKSLSGMANSYLTLAGAYSSLNNLEKAEEYYQKSLELYQNLKADFGVAVVSVNLAQQLKNNKQYEKALKYFNQSLEYYTKLNNIKGIMTCYNFIGSLYLVMNDFDQALDFYENWLKIAEEKNMENEIAFANFHIGKVHFSKKDYFLSLNYYNKSKTNYHLENYLDANTLSSSYYKNYLALDSIAEAKEELNKIIVYHYESLKRNFPILSEVEKGKYFELMAKDYELIYDFTYNYSNENPELLGKIYDITLLSKGILLKSSTAMRNNILNSNDSTLIKKYNDWIHLKENISKNTSLEKDTKAEEEKVNELEKELSKLSNEFSNINKTLSPSWLDVKASLKKNEAAIEFINFNHCVNKNDTLTENIFCALIITNKSKYPKLVRVCRQIDLMNAIKNSDNNVEKINNLYNGNQNSPSLLYNLIWKPLEKELKNIKTIYYSPVGLLNKISLSAIKNSKNVFLCEQYNLNIKSNKNSAHLENIHLTDQSFALFGGINYDSDSTTNKIWNYLTGSNEEIKLIKSTIESKNNRVELFNAENASEEKFKDVASNFNILHVATHGFYYDNTSNNLDSNNISHTSIKFRGKDKGFGTINYLQNPNPMLRSGIVFAGANDVWSRKNASKINSDYKEDGVLTAQEISLIDMTKVDLVVLSACETGLGEIKGFEGVYGFQRALQIAGSKNIIISLWQVSDKETSEFMEYFYTFFKSGLSIRDSFNATQKEMLKKYPPYFWAAFELIE